MYSFFFWERFSFFLVKISKKMSIKSVQQQQEKGKSCRIYVYGMYTCTQKANILLLFFLLYFFFLFFFFWSNTVTILCSLNFKWMTRMTHVYFHHPLNYFLDFPSIRTMVHSPLNISLILRFLTHWDCTTIIELWTFRHLIVCGLFLCVCGSISSPP